MERNQILEAIKKIKEGEKRKFAQTIDLAINLKEIDINKEEGKLEEFLPLPHGRAKPAKIAAFVGPELKEHATKFCDFFILSDDFSKWNDARKIKKLAREYDFFIAQANIMPDIAKTFGRFFGPVGKMPNPKAGLVVPPKANLEPLVKNLRKTIKVAIKKAPVILCAVGSETMADEQIADNIMAVLERVKTKLPKAQHNIANIIIKTTMGKPVKIV
ncbi:MAG: 50S ribosomal protein L1 [Candidatus Nanoarchaeia archaeon]